MFETYNMAGISTPAVPSEPWRTVPSHENITVSSNKDSLLENQRGYSTGPASRERSPPAARQRTRRKEKTGVEVACAWIVEHQTGWTDAFPPMPWKIH